MARSQTELRRYLYGSDYTQKPDEGALNDKELSDRLAAFQELGQAKGAIDPAEIQRQLETQFSSRGDKTAKQNSQVISDFVANNGRIPTQQEMQQILNPANTPGILQNISQDQDIYNQLSSLAGNQVKSIDTGEDVKRLQGIQSGRAFSNQRDTDINDFLTGLPDQLKSSRDEFLQGETDRAAGEFQDYAPQAMAQLNARGLLFSGSPEDVLTDKATNLAGGLDDLQFKAEQDDNQFYFNAAYQNTLKTELATRDDYKSALDTERSRIMGDRENNFRSTQADYDRQLSDELNRSDLQRSYDSNAAKLKAQKDSAESQKRGQLFSQIDSAVGTGVGAAVGGPVGAVVGSQAGAGLGSVGSKIG